MFTIIVPIKNLKLGTKKITFGELRISGQLNKHISTFLEGKIAPFIEEGTSFATTEVAAVDFIEAYQHAIKQIDHFLDWVSYLRNFSLSKVGGKVREWDRELSATEPRITGWFYGEVAGIDCRVAMDSRNRKANETLVITSDNEGFLDLYADEFKGMYHRKDEKMINAVHWLRRAREEGTLKDRLLDHFTSMEFLVSNQKVKKIFSKEKRDEILELVSSSMTEKEFQRFGEHFSMINSPSFKLRIDSFISDRSIPMSRSEKECLERMRRARNSIEHGLGDVDVNETDLRSLGNVVEKLIIYAIAKDKSNKPKIKV